MTSSGELGYKARWGAQARAYTDIQFARPFSLGSAYLQVLHNAGQGKAWLRRNLPQFAWDALHKINVRTRRMVRKDAASPIESQSDVPSPIDSTDERGNPS